MVDPFGTILRLLRNDATVAGIVGDRVNAEAKTPPSIRLTDLNATKRAFGPMSGQTGVLLWTGVAHCYGVDNPSGAISAYQLAAAVSDLLDRHGSHLDGTRLMLRAYAPDIDGLTRDPDTHWPQYDVVVRAYFAAEAVVA